MEALKKITLNLPLALWKTLKATAEKERRTFTAQLILTIERGLKKK